MAAIRKYYLAQQGFNQGIGEVAAPKQIIDVILSDRFHWTPQEIDAIPKYRLEEYMMVLNTKDTTFQEANDRRGAEKEVEASKFGKGGIRKKIQV